MIPTLSTLSVRSNLETLLGRASTAERAGQEEGARARHGPRQRYGAFHIMFWLKVYKRV